jgi:phospholipid/cholesterol/gamma-HCH transport system substrate-binding protein
MALSGKAGDIADDVKVITANLRKVFGGEEGEEGIRDIFLNVQDITMRLAGALEDNQQIMNQIAQNIELFTQNLAVMTGENRQALYDAIAVMPAITKNLETISANLAQITNENNDEINDVIRELAASTAQLSIAMEHIASISRKIDEGEGTIGELINDKDAIEEISETLDSVNEFVGRIRQIQTYLSYRGEYFRIMAT